MNFCAILSSVSINLYKAGSVSFISFRRPLTAAGSEPWKPKASRSTTV